VRKEVTQLSQNKKKNMEILKDIKNDLQNRREIEVVVDAEKNPGLEDSVKFISSKFNSDVENIVINQIKGKFGRKAFLIAASIYGNKEAREKAEPKSKKDVGAEPKEEKPAEAQAPKEEAPAKEETPKEEKPAEEMKEEEK